MTHVRKQVREAFKTALENYLDASYTVYASRKSPKNFDPDETVIDMRIMNDQTRMQETMTTSTQDARVHVASVYVRVQKTGREDEIDDLLDDDEVKIVAAIETFNWEGLLEQPPEIVQVNFSDDAEGAYVLGAMVVRIDVEYRISRDDPETVIQ